MGEWVGGWACGCRGVWLAVWFCMYAWLCVHECGRVYLVGHLLERQLVLVVQPHLTQGEWLDEVVLAVLDPVTLLHRGLLIREGLDAATRQHDLGVWAGGEAGKAFNGRGAGRVHGGWVDDVWGMSCHAMWAVRMIEFERLRVCTVETLDLKGLAAPSPAASLGGGSEC